MDESVGHLSLSISTSWRLGFEAEWYQATDTLAHRSTNSSANLLLALGIYTASLLVTLAFSDGGDSNQKSFLTH